MSLLGIYAVAFQSAKNVADQLARRAYTLAGLQARMHRLQ